MKPKVLLIDIETAPMLVYAWGLGEQHVGHEQIHTDWSILAYAAKWLDESRMIYNDTRDKFNPRNDKEIVEDLWKLLDSADIVIGQNSKRFDIKKINARLLKYKMKPPSSFKQIDTLQIKKKVFGLTSNKLAYSSKEFCEKYKKLTHKEFPGLELWIQCLNGDKKAWAEMERYNKHDVLAMEELYKILIPWDSSVSFSLYRDDGVSVCSCGSTNLHKRGFYYTASGKYQKYRCTECGSETYAGQSLLPKAERHKGVKR